MPNVKVAITRNVAVSAVFGGLSFVLSALTTPFIPRVPGWGIAFVDPVSIIWVTAYLIFGLSTGLMTSAIGTVGLMFFDPFTPIGPLLKLFATLPLILSLDLGMRAFRFKPYSGNSLRPLRRYVLLSLVGITGRIVILTMMNILLFLTIFSLSYASIDLFGMELSSWNAVIVVSVLINAEQSIWDCGVPYLLSFSAKAYDHFRFW
jgi:riboflavin transporter FmnP